MPSPPPTEERLDTDHQALRLECAAGFDRLLTGLVGWLDGIEPEDATGEEVVFTLDTIRDLARAKAAADGHDHIGPIRRREVERALRDTAHHADKRQRIDFAANLLAARAAHRIATRRVRRYRLQAARLRYREQHQTWTLVPAQAGRHRRASGHRPVRRVGSRRSSSSGSDPDDGEPEPPELRLWRHPRPSCSPSLLRVLIVGAGR